jgi:hypothetical protein
MTRLTDRLERDLREVAAGAHPSPSAWGSIEPRLGDAAAREVTLVLTPAPNRSKRSVWLAVAAAVLVALIGSIAVLTRDGADPDETVVDLPDLTTTFVSPRNGFSIKHPSDAVLTPATQIWGPNEDVEEGYDVLAIDSVTVFTGGSTETPSDGRCLNSESEPIACGSVEEQVDRQLHERTGGCGVPRSQHVDITIDEESGRLAECRNRIEAIVVSGRRFYFFTLSHDRMGARAVFDALAATIDLTPETAVDFPAMPTTFVSPTYGYSYRYFDRGGLQPATGRWDPADDQVDTLQLDDRFDAVETGLGAYFVSASTAIPEGVSVDAWYDEHVAASGCGVPRRRQAELTIDAESGRVVECTNQVAATVVAGGRLYLFILGHSRLDARAWFDAWVATIDLTPETAAP